MFRKLIFQDFLGIWLLLTGCLIGGLLINEVRPAPLSLVYSPPVTRLKQSVAKLNPASTFSPIAPEGNVERAELQMIVANRAALILDARPEIFYRMSHIPTALSLPRDDFENRYQSLQSTLQSHRGEPIVVYCSGSDCHDSQMVADALQKLGYPRVRLFLGGWNAWENANLPEEKP